MVIFLTLLLNFLLNLYFYGNILIGILNALLLLFSIIFYLKYSQTSFKSLKLPYLLLLAAMPVFVYKTDVFTLLLAVGIVPLSLLYLNTRLKIPLLFVLFFYLSLASLYANRVIIFPFSLRTDLFIFSDHWTNLYIPQMQKEALYIPYKLRFLVFNSSIYIYVLLSKTAGLFMFKNLYDVLLIANLYPLIKGLILDLKSWDKTKSLIVLCVLLISFSSVISRSVDIFNTFALLSPFILFFILKGFGQINKKIYLLLFIFSLILATSPYK